MADPTQSPPAAQARAVDTPEHGSGGGGSGRVGLLRNPRVAWTVAVLAVLAAALFAFQWQVLVGHEEARRQAREAAEVMAAQITTFDGVEIDAFVERLRDLATGDYADQVAELFSPDFRAALRDNEVESVGEVVRSFVQELDGDEAEAFVIVRQTSINAELDEPVTDELRMELTLAHEDGQWLIDDVAVLGPSVAPLAAPGAQ